MKLRPSGNEQQMSRYQQLENNNQYATTLVTKYGPNHRSTCPRCEKAILVCWRLNNNTAQEEKATTGQAAQEERAITGQDWSSYSAQSAHTHDGTVPVPDRVDRKMNK